MFPDVTRIDPTEAADLIEALDAYQAALYPPESNHLEPIEALRQSGVRMLGCRVDGELVAMGAVKLMHGYGEIKRMYVTPAHRGRGLAKALLTALEAEILHSGRRLSRLETGIHQHEAVGLYERLGYRRRGPFGDYTDDPLSVFMEKQLTARDR